MELFSPFKDNEERRKYLISIVISIFLFLVFDYCYQYNFFYLRGVTYYEDHTIPAFLYSISDIPFVITTIWTLAKFSRGILEWFRYVASLIIDFCCIYIIFAFRDPSQENTNIDILILVSLALFSLKIILFRTWRRFKILKLS